MSTESKNTYIITAYTEHNIGLLNRITIIFTRRGLNIKSLSVSDCEIQNTAKFVIEVTTTDSLVNRVVAQIEKQVEVIAAFAHPVQDVVGREVSLFKVRQIESNKADLFRDIVESRGARVVESNEKYTVVEYTTSDQESVNALYCDLQEFDILQFVRSGRVAVSRAKMLVSTILSGLKDR